MYSELVISVGEFMYRENILTKNGLDFLYTIHCTPIQEFLYHSVALKMTELYGEIVEKKELDKTSYQRLRKIALNSYIRYYSIKKELSFIELQEYYSLREIAFVMDYPISIYGAHKRSL